MFSSQSLRLSMTENIPNTRGKARRMYHSLSTRSRRKPWTAFIERYLFWRMIVASNIMWTTFTALLGLLDQWGIVKLSKRGTTTGSQLTYQYLGAQSRDSWQHCPNYPERPPSLASLKKRNCSRLGFANATALSEVSSFIDHVPAWLVVQFNFAQCAFKSS